MMLGLIPYYILVKYRGLSLHHLSGPVYPNSKIEATEARYYAHIIEIFVREFLAYKGNQSTNTQSYRFALNLASLT